MTLENSVENTKKIIKKDLTNQRFGMLVALYPIKKNNRIFWHCHCDCGNEKDIRADALTRNISKSCGCQVQKRINLIGQKFGLLTVIEMLPNDQCKCLCDCGNEIIVLGHNLKRGNTRSCGCFLNRSRGETKIKQLLDENNILFKKELSLPNLKGKGGGFLRFDFGIYKQQQLIYLIEFDGEQHYILNGYSGKFLKENDQIKNNWCKENNIPLIRIPYTHLENLKIEDLLLETSKFII